MSATFVRCAVAVVLAGPALAQNPIQWNSDAQAAVNRAQETELPVLFLVPGSRDDDGSEIEDSQNRAFRDPVVKALVEERFVQARLARTVDNLKLLSELGAPTAYGNYLLVVTPHGKLVGTVGPTMAADPEKLTAQLARLFRGYRAGLYEDRYKKVLETEQVKPAELLPALKRIREMTITEAEAEVAKLFERDDWPRQTRQEIYQTAAVLSTPTTLDPLLARAADEELAAAALQQATPAGAEYLLAQLDLEKPAQVAVVYDAITRIVTVPDAQSRGFWTRATAAAREAELERVRNVVKTAAEHWRQTIGALR